MLASDTQIPDNDSSAESGSSPLATSSPSAPGGTSVAARLTRKGTRLSTVKKQLDAQIEETTRLKNIVRLLETEIDKKNKEIEGLNKRDSTQKSEIKNLTKSNDTLRRELSTFKGVRKFIPQTNEGRSNIEKNDNVNVTQTSEISSLLSLKERLLQPLNLCYRL